MATGLNKSILVLVRHGQSIYNLENKFTGWKDVDLTEQGKQEAVQAGNILSNYQFDFAYTSNLKRANETLSVILESNNSKLNVVKNQALNERDYGDLIAQNKKEAAIEFGADQVQLWRRSFDVPPPNGESLEMTYNRTIPYFKLTVEKDISNCKNIILSAHGNSIRAIIMYLFKYSKKEILSTEIGWCEPWVITFKNDKISNFKVLTREGVISKSNYPRPPFLVK